MSFTIFAANRAVRAIAADCIARVGKCLKNRIKSNKHMNPKLTVKKLDGHSSNLLTFVLVIGLAFTFTIGNIPGVILYGIYLCRTGRAGEVNRWARSIEYKRSLQNRAITFLKGYSKSVRKNI